MKRILALCMAAVLLFSLLPAIAVSADTSGDWRYTVSGDKATITGYTGSASSVTIPSTLGGCPVTSIGEDAFYECRSLTSVTIPDSVTRIGWGAFYGCTSLTSITIPDSVTSVESGVFMGCTALTGITAEAGNPVYHSAGNCLIETASGTLVAGCKNSVIPADGSVTRIDDFAFCESGLTEITIPDSVTHIGQEAFSCTKLTEITLPGRVTSMGESVFCGCSDLKSAVIEKGASLGVAMFIGCTALTDVTLPDTVTSVADDMFSGCTKLTSITIPDSVTSIGSTAFWYSGLTEITIPDSVTSIGEWAFCECHGLTSVTIPDSVTSIGSHAFAECFSLDTVYYTGTEVQRGNIAIGSNNDWLTGATWSYESSGDIPCITVIKNGSTCTLMWSAVTDADGYEVANLTTGQTETVTEFQKDLTDLPEDMLYTFKVRAFTVTDGGTVYKDWSEPHSVNLVNESHWRYTVSREGKATVYGDAGKAYTGSAASVAIPDTLGGYPVVAIGRYAFRNCTELTGVIIGDGVTSIGYEAFYGCTKLTSLTVPDSVTAISSSAFSGCTGLTEFTVPDSITVLGEKTFYGCSGLTDVRFGRNIKSIGDMAFYHCTGITALSLPDSVTTLGEKAFYGCSGLTALSLGKGLSTIGASAFYNCTRLTEVTVPDNVTAIGDSAFAYCTRLGSFTLENDAAVIGSKVLYHCTKLADVTLGSISTIPDSAFSGCAGLTSITIPDSVTTIGSSAFSDCTGLASVTIPSSVTSLAPSVFSGCSGLTSVTVPDSVTAIGEKAFSGCSGLTNITIPDSITSLAPYVFSGCTKLSSITIPDSVTTIGQNAFADTGYSNNTANWENGVLYCGRWLIRADPAALPATCEIKAGTRSIADYAFYNCTGLTGLILPVSVAYVGYDAFDTCSRLKSVLYAGTEADRKSLSGGSFSQPLKSAVWHYEWVKAVSSLTAAADSQTAVTLTWDRIGSTSGYKVTNLTTGKTATVTAAKKQYTGLKAGTLYAFRVQPYVNDDGVVTYGEWSESVSVKTLLKAPAPTYTANSTTALTVSWSRITGAAGYQIKNLTTGKTVTVTALKRKYTGLKMGKTYTFQVRAYDTVNGTKRYTAWKTISASTKPAKVKKPTLSYAKGKLTVKWSAAAAADGYQVSFLSGDPFFKKQVSTAGRSLTQKVQKGFTYYARVRAYRKVGGKTVYGTYSKTVSVKAK